MSLQNTNKQKKTIDKTKKKQKKKPWLTRFFWVMDVCYDALLNII